MKTMDFDRIANLTPLNREAATVRDGAGEHWEATLRGPNERWKAPPPPEGVRSSLLQDLTGFKAGRLTVIRFHRYSGKSNPVPTWLVRCTCGDYELRQHKKLLNNTNPDACCLECVALNVLRTRAAKPNTKRSRKAAARLLDAMAGSAR